MTLFLHSFHPSPVIAEFGPFIVRWYGLLLAVGALLGYALTLRLARRRGISADDVTTWFSLTLLAGFLGGRLYHVLNEFGFYWRHPGEIFSVWNGGLAIHGALLGGALTLLLLARRRGVSFLRITDLFVPAVALGQAIGRWGNYFNQELFGKPTNLPWGIPIDQVYRPAGMTGSTYFHPTFLYESLWDLVVLAVLLLLLRRQTSFDLRRGGGMVTLVYLGLTSVGRFGTELLRIDRTPHLWGVRLPLLVAALLVLASLAGIMVLRTRHAAHDRP